MAAKSPKPAVHGVVTITTRVRLTPALEKAFESFRALQRRAGQRPMNRDELLKLALSKGLQHQLSLEAALKTGMRRLSQEPPRRPVRVACPYGFGEGLKEKMEKLGDKLANEGGRRIDLHALVALVLQVSLEQNADELIRVGLRGLEEAVLAKGIQTEEDYEDLKDPYAHFRR